MTARHEGWYWPGKTRLRGCSIGSWRRVLWPGQVDRAVFAPRPPTDPEVDAAWALSDAVLERRDEGEGRLRSVLARLNPASLAKR